MTQKRLTDDYAQDQWADEHGYHQYRCARCGKVFWDDSVPGCPNGCDEEEWDEWDEWDDPARQDK